MPDDPISKALAGAKSALAGAKKFTASTGDTDPSRFAAKPAASAPAAPKKPESGLVREASDVASGIKYRTDQAKALSGNTPGMKKGGVVPKTGNYKMHEGEDVVTADKSNLQEVIDRAKDALGGPMRPKHGMRSTHIDHHSNGSHTVRHSPLGGSEMGKIPEETSYAVKDTNELQDKIKEYLGDKEAPAAPSKSASSSKEPADKD